jgi:PAS domain S-box-containing protein
MEFFSDDALFAGNGNVRSLLRMHDWSGFTAGPPEQWPAVIRRTIQMLLDSDSPMSFLWGPDLHYFYNDAYIQLIGAKHPSGLARPFWKSWEEVSEVFSPILDRAMRGEFCSLENMEFPVMRRGMLEKAYFTYSLLPIFDEAGNVIGILNPAIETTAQVLASRRQQFQLQLADRIRPLADPDEVVAVASELLGKHLGVARVVYAEADDPGETVRIRPDWTDDTLASMAGLRLRLDDFGPLMASLVRAGKPLIVGDVTTDARSKPYAEAYAAISVRAVLAIPLMKAGRLRAILGLHDSRPHHWTEHEIALAQDMVDRTWSAVEQARSQAELRAERDQSRYIFDSMTEGFAVLDKNWSVLQMNAEGLRIAQHAVHEVIGKNYWDIWPELKGTPIEEIYRKVKATCRADVVEFPYTFPDNRNGWMEVRAHPALDGGIAFFFRDITERKSTQERLKEADRRKDEFLAMLAHELRNPLAPIGAAAELLQMGKLDEERVRQTSQIIGRQVNHMTSLVDDLLDVSRVTRGLVELDNAPLDVSHIVTDAIEQVTPLIRSRRHHLALHLTPDATMVLGDRKRLVQVIANILNNAAKYTHEGGNIRLTTDVRDSHVLIEVSDNGIGMAPDLVAHAFDLFAQAERTSDRSSGGLGLGLALVKSLVELHHGTVTCESAGTGKGSKFTVCLPRLPAEDKHDAPQYDNNVMRRGNRSLRVMVVDDNVDAASMLAMLLEASGHEVSVEHESRRALERARLEMPQVCLLDIGLPEIDGNELAQRLRAQPETAQSVLIAVTGYGQERDREQMLAAGFDHHLVKPVDTRKLASILAEVSRV